MTRKMLLAAWALLGLSQADETPIGPKWWPSEWGAEDQRGAINRQGPERVAGAARLIREGRIYSLGRVYEQGMPIQSTRQFHLVLPGSPTGGPRGDNGFVFFEELVTASLGQVGTQLDGLAHVAVRMNGDDYFYNGFRRSEITTPYGHRKLGIENAGPFFSRGVLADLPSYKGVERLKAGELVTADDVEGALRKQGVSLGQGDVLVLRTGHGQLWKDGAAYLRSAPGLALEAARWIARRKILLFGSDTSSCEALPHEDPKRPHEAHQHFLVRNGIYLLENLDLEELAREKVAEFAFILAPLRLKGATGSPGNPMAVR
jgi:kynurenine formamidase